MRNNIELRIYKTASEGFRRSKEWAGQEPALLTRFFLNSAGESPVAFRKAE